MVQNLFVESGDAAHETTSDQQQHLSNDFPLGIEGFTYGDLYRPGRLRALAEAFYAEVGREDAALGARLAEYVSARGENLKGTKAESELLIAAAPHLSRFVARLFRVEEERERMAARLLEWEKNYPKEGVRQEAPWSDERARETAAAASRLKGSDAEALLAAWRVDESDDDENRSFVRSS